MPRGVKITNEQREEIRKLWSSGCARYKIADRYGISKETVTKITKDADVDLYHQPGKIAATIACEGVGIEDSKDQIPQPKKSEPKPVNILVAEQLITVCGMKTNCIYKLNSKLDTIAIDGAALTAELTIDQLPEFAQELMEVFAMAKKMKTNRGEIV